MHRSPLHLSPSLSLRFPSPLFFYPSPSLTLSLSLSYTISTSPFPASGSRSPSVMSLDVPWLSLALTLCPLYSYFTPTLFPYSPVFFQVAFWFLFYPSFQLIFCLHDYTLSPSLSFSISIYYHISLSLSPSHHWHHNHRVVKCDVIKYKFLEFLNFFFIFRKSIKNNVQLSKSSYRKYIYSDGHISANT